MRAAQTSVPGGTMHLRSRWLAGMICVCAALVSGLGAGTASAAPSPCASLHVSSVVIKPTDPSQPQLISGQPAEIEIGIKNTGTCAAGGFVARFMLAKNSITVVSGSVAHLGVGESTTLTLAYGFPKAGNFETEVMIDPLHEVAQTSYASDIALTPITVVPVTKKLVITGFSVVSADPTGAVVEGRPATATITVENAGNVPAGAFDVRWTPYTFATVLTSAVPAGLAPGESTTVTLAFTYKFHGTATATVAALPAGESIALDTITRETTIEAALPNLRIVSVTPFPNFATRPSRLRVEIENNGNAAAGPFIVQWSPGSGQTAQQIQVTGLGEGERKTIEFTYVFPKPGSYEGLVTLDSTKKIKELFTTEKTAKTNFTIAEGTVDLTVTSLTVEAVTPGPVIQETPTVATVKVKNLGSIASPTFVTELNPDSLGLSGSGSKSVTEESPSLEPGEERTIQFSFTYPKPSCSGKDCAKFGNYRTVAEVNPRHVVKETNYANNIAYTEVNVQPLPVKLEFSPNSIEVSSASLLSKGELFPTEPASASFTVRDNGPIAVGPFEVQLRSGVQGGLPQTKLIEGLNPGESKTEHFEIKYSKPGSYTIEAVLDSGESVDKVGPTSGGQPYETIEIFRTINVTPIDLRFTSGLAASFLDAPPNVSYPGDKGIETVTVENNSPVASGSFAVQLETLENGAPAGSGSKQTKFIENLKPLESKVVEFKVTLYKKATYFSTAILEPYKGEQKRFGTGPIDSSTVETTVKEKEASLLVEVPTITVTEPIPSNWYDDLLVYDPGAKCYLKRESSKGTTIFKVVHNEAPGGGELCLGQGEIPGVKAQQYGFGATEGVTLKEETPLRASVEAEAYQSHTVGKGKFKVTYTTGSSAGKASLERKRSQYAELAKTGPQGYTLHAEGCHEAEGNEKPTECFFVRMNLSLSSLIGPPDARRRAARLAARAGLDPTRPVGVAAPQSSQVEEGEEPEGTVAEKQAQAEQEAAAHEAAERESFEAEATANEAAEAAKATVAEQEAIAVVQEFTKEEAQEQAEAEAETEPEGGATAQSAARRSR